MRAKMHKCEPVNGRGQSTFTFCMKILQYFEISPANVHTSVPLQSSKRKFFNFNWIRSSKIKCNIFVSICAPSNLLLLTLFKHSLFTKSSVVTYLDDTLIAVDAFWMSQNCNHHLIPTFDYLFVISISFSRNLLIKR